MELGEIHRHCLEAGTRVDRGLDSLWKAAPTRVLAARTPHVFSSMFVDHEAKLRHVVSNSPDWTHF